jgi:hypothetical protein
VQYLVDHGANIDAKTDLGWTPLMMSRGVFLNDAALPTLPWRTWL